MTLIINIALKVGITINFAEISGNISAIRAIMIKGTRI